MSIATPVLDLEHEALEIQALLETWEATRHLPVDTWLEGVQEASERARQLGDDVLLARGLIGVAFGHVVRLESVPALELAQQALDLLYKHGFPDLEATAHQMMGRVHYDLGSDETALEFFEKALVLATDENLKLRLRDNIAAISIELGRLQEALEVQEQILASPNAVHLANTHSNMAIALHRLSDQHQETGQATKAQELLEQAQKHIQTSLELARASQEQDTEAHALTTLASIFKHQGNFAQASVHYHEAFDLAHRAGYPWVELQASIALGILAQRQGQHQEAKTRLEQALTRANELEYKEHASRIHAYLSEVFESLEDYREALQHHRRFYDLDVSVKSEAASKRVEALSVRFQVERAQLEAQLQRERSEALNVLNQQLEHQALTDPLTGLANRRAFTEHFKRTFAAAKEAGSALSVVMIDLDHFKRVNDQFSHAVGDDVLKAFAKILQEHCRATDLAARYGGEEFVLLMPGVEARVTFNACERLRTATQAFDWSKIQKGLQVTASFGFGDVLQALDHVALLEMADQQLYSAKNAGRNQVQPAL